MPLVVEVSRNEELDDRPGDCIHNSTSAAEYDVLQLPSLGWQAI